MKRMKELMISIGAFITSTATKVYAEELEVIEDKYGVFDPEVTTKYGPPPEPVQTTGQKILGAGKFALPILLFIIGIFVVINKTLTKKVKIIIVSALAILAVAGYIIMNYFSK